MVLRLFKSSIPFSTAAILLIVCLAGLSSCRTSQQTRRGNTAARTPSGGSQGGMNSTTDSLIMVQDKLLRLIDTLSDVVEKDQDRIQMLEQQVASLRAALERRGMMPVTPMDNNQVVPPPTPLVPGEQVPRSVTGAPMPSSAQTAQFTTEYNNALQMFNDGRYEDALQQFHWLSQVNSGSAYAPNYAYWAGESYYALGRYRDAIASFQGVLTNYPNSAKADDAQFKIGESYEKLGNKDRARNAYRYLEMNYPNSEYLTRANTRLRRLQ